MDFSTLYFKCHPVIAGCRVRMKLSQVDRL